MKSMGLGILRRRDPESDGRETEIIPGAGIARHLRPIPHPPQGALARLAELERATPIVNAHGALLATRANLASIYPSARSLLPLLRQSPNYAAQHFAESLDLVAPLVNGLRHARQREATNGRVSEQAFPAPPRGEPAGPARLGG